MRRILIAAAVVAISCTAAQAGSDVMTNFYGNTAVSTGGIAESHSYYRPDHTFTMKVPSFGVEFKGSWSVDNGTLCRTFEKAPPGVTNPLCTPVVAHNVGDTWTVTVDGKTRTVTLVAGIQ
jgi:hypothetical protein